MSGTGLGDSADPGVETAGGVRQQAAAGVFWLTAQRWFTRIFSLVTVGVLTRFLSPTDFGTVAAALTVLPFFYLLADLGFAAYIVQVDRADQGLLSTSFWFSTVASVGMWLALVVSAPLSGHVFDDPRVVPVLQVLAFSVVLTGVASVPGALLRRSMRFSVIAAQGAAAAIVAQGVAIAMTLAGLGVWALVGQTLSAGLVGAVLAWRAVDWRPSFTFSAREFFVMVRFGSQVLGVEVLAMARAWGEAAIVSSVLGLATLGYLSIAQRLVQIVQDLTGGALVPVSTVAFAKVRDSADRLRTAYLRALTMTYAVLSLPLTVLMIASPLLIPIAFGRGWEPSFGAAQVLALAGTLTVGAALDHGLFYGVGRPGRWFGYALVIETLTVLTTAFMTRWGLVGVAWGTFGVALLATVCRWVLVAGVLTARVRELCRPFGLLAAAVAAPGIVGWAVLRATSTLPDVLSAGAIGLTMMAVHLCVVRLVAPNVLTDGWALVRGRVVRLRIPAPLRRVLPVKGPRPGRSGESVAR
jgi:O-antigen/teichoic acid export membrane protein